MHLFLLRKRLKNFLTTIRLHVTGPFCLFVLGSGDHSLGAGDQIPSQQTRQLKSLQISDTNKGMSAYSSVTNFVSSLEIFKCIEQDVICVISLYTVLMIIDSLTSQLENLSPAIKKRLQFIIESLSNHKGKNFCILTRGECRNSG